MKYPGVVEDADIAAFVTQAAKEHVLELADVGTPFDRTPSGDFAAQRATKTQRKCG